MSVCIQWWNLSNPDTLGAEESVPLGRCPDFRGYNVVHVHMNGVLGTAKCVLFKSWVS